MTAMASMLQTRPFVGVKLPKRTSPAARPRAVCVRAGSHETAGFVAGTVLALSAFVGSPALAAESRGTLPEGGSASSVQKRITSSDSMRGGGQPDKSNTTYPETAGGSDAGRVPPIAGRSNLTGTAAAPEKAK